MIKIKKREQKNNFCEIGDNRKVMRQWIDEGVKVKLCVTSPPYFKLRDYGTAVWDGGLKDCDHVEKTNQQGNSGYGRASATKFQYKNKCLKCGAVRTDQQIGQEKTPEDFIKNLVSVFGLVRELLQDDGTCWIVIGDTYQSDGSLYLIPQRLVVALQKYGWHVRQICIWAKATSGRMQTGTCMPESVHDRCTTSHEYVFMLSKSPNYSFDMSEILEPTSRSYQGDKRGTELRQRLYSNSKYVKAGMVKKKDHPTENAASGSGLHLPKKEQMANRNRRTVWLVNPKPYKEAHFAVFPTDLIAPIIKAGAKIGEVVFDPFFGSGTVGDACTDLQRNYRGIDLNSNYLPLQDKRTKGRLKFY